MKRAALWLVQEVGVGAVFTKAQLREAFPTVSQIDRRLRDLRDFGWRIDTKREEAELLQDEQRFVEQGAPVWEPGQAIRPAQGINETERRNLLARDGYFCRSCGISTGDEYPGTNRRSQLDVARRPVVLPSGAVQVQNVIECARCRVGGRDLEADLGEVLSRVGRLSGIERQMLASWIAKDSRTFSEVEQVWAAYRSLPAEAREHVRNSLE